jgi:hypothetical protein
MALALDRKENFRDRIFHVLFSGHILATRRLVFKLLERHECVSA